MLLPQLHSVVAKVVSHVDPKRLAAMLAVGLIDIMSNYLFGIDFLR